MQIFSLSLLGRFSNMYKRNDNDLMTPRVPMPAFTVVNYFSNPLSPIPSPLFHTHVYFVGVFVANYRPHGTSPANNAGTALMDKDKTYSPHVIINT